jgi:hypothetical protein
MFIILFILLILGIFFYCDTWFDRIIATLIIFGTFIFFRGITPEEFYLELVQFLKPLESFIKKIIQEYK